MSPLSPFSIFCISPPPAIINACDKLTVLLATDDTKLSQLVDSIDNFSTMTTNNDNNNNINPHLSILLTHFTKTGIKQLLLAHQMVPNADISKVAMEGLKSSLVPPGLLGGLSKLLKEVATADVASGGSKTENGGVTAGKYTGLSWKVGVSLVDSSSENGEMKPKPVITLSFDIGGGTHTFDVSYEKFMVLKNRLEGVRNEMAIA